MDLIPCELLSYSTNPGKKTKTLQTESESRAIISALQDARYLKQMHRRDHTMSLVQVKSEHSVAVFAFPDHI